MLLLLSLLLLLLLRLLLHRHGFWKFLKLLYVRLCVCVVSCRENGKHELKKTIKESLRKDYNYYNYEREEEDFRALLFVTVSLLCTYE